MLAYFKKAVCEPKMHNSIEPDLYKSILAKIVNIIITKIDESSHKRNCQKITLLLEHAKNFIEKYKNFPFNNDPKMAKICLMPC